MQKTFDRNACFVCGKTTDLKQCENCNSYSYCSKRCQRADWYNGHFFRCRKLIGNDNNGSERLKDEDEKQEFGRIVPLRKILKTKKEFTGIFFGHNLITSPNSSESVIIWQVLDNYWPLVTKRDKVIQEFTLPFAPGRALIIVDGNEWDSVERFKLWEKYRSIGASKYANLIKEEKTLEKAIQIGQEEEYVQWLHKRKLVSDEEDFISLNDLRANVQIVLKTIWTPVKQRRVLEVALKKKFDPERNKKLVGALLSTGDKNLHRISYRLDPPSVLGLDPASGNGLDLLGKMLMERREELRIANVGELESPTLTKQGIALIEGLDLFDDTLTKENAPLVGLGPIRFIYRQFQENTNIYAESNIKTIGKEDKLISLAEVQEAARDAYKRIRTKNNFKLRDCIGNVSKKNNIWIFDHCYSAWITKDDE